MATSVLAGVAGAFGVPLDVFAALGFFARCRGLRCSGAVFWRFTVVSMSLDEVISAALRFGGAPGMKDNAVGMPPPGCGTLVMLMGAMMKM